MSHLGQHTAAQCRKIISSLGLNVVLEKDATNGYEFLVSDASGLTVACGWSGGTKTEVLNEAVTHPAILLRLSRAALAVSS